METILDVLQAPEELVGPYRRSGVHALDLSKRAIEEQRMNEQRRVSSGITVNGSTAIHRDHHCHEQTNGTIREEVSDDDE